MPRIELIEIFPDAERQLMICNACRYCEGYCPVFPAMERRREFNVRDLAYLAYLCHDCRDCFYACMYTPPHEFELNIPNLLNRVRDVVYRNFVKPDFLGTFARDPYAYLFLQLFVTYALFLPLITNAPLLYDVLAKLFFVLGIASLTLIAYHMIIFWRLVSGGTSGSLLRSLGQALYEALLHKWFYGGGEWCYVPTTKRGMPYRFMVHILLFYGVALLLAAHIVPAYVSLPESLMSAYVTVATSPLQPVNVIVGVLVAGGCAFGLFSRVLSSKVQQVVRSTYLDYAILVVLLLIVLTGLSTYLCRLYLPTATFFMFLVHASLAFTAISLFPYTKYVHMFYRLLALLKNARESSSR